MAEALKNLFNQNYIESIANNFSTVDKNFNSDVFKKTILNNDWNQLELKERIRKISIELSKNLSGNYQYQLSNILQVAKNYSGLQGFIFPDFVEINGLKFEKDSLEALKILTQYSTSEFAIRPFIKNNPEVIKAMINWSTNKNFHVRRLSSEGCRPLLPWSFKLETFVKDPTPIIPILYNLKEDNEAYVNKSVANNLNDISKNHPELVLDLCKEWKKNNHTITDKIIKHGLRTLLKKGDEKALSIIGLKLTPKFNISDINLSKNLIKIGESTNLNFEIQNLDKNQIYRIEYDVFYLKNNGTYSRKTFQISQSCLNQNQSRKFSFNIKFKDLTTRKHYPGLHHLDLKINGKYVVRKSFNLY